jgi:Tol biopolymer transport system component
VTRRNPPEHDTSRHAGVAAPRRVGLPLVITALVVSGCTSTGTGTTPSPGPVSTPPTASDAPRGPGPGEDWIVFEAQGHRVMLAKADGSVDFSPATDAPAMQSTPTWDPTGTRIAFAVSEDGTDDLWTVGADGSDAAQLVECTEPCLFITHPAWSPDGSRIAYSRTVLEGSTPSNTLEVVDVSTGRGEVLLGPWHTELTAGATWSPDGARIAVEILRLSAASMDAAPVSSELAVVALDDLGSLRTVTDPARFAEAPDWSPDGTALVYGARVDLQEEETDLYTVSPDGGEPARLTTLVEDGGFAADPAYTADGSRILFSGRASGTSREAILAVASGGGTVGPAVPSRMLAGHHPRSRPAG